jgi:PIN domain nuclease of toxin-antitoxin system
LLLDTHVWVWWLTPGSPLTRTARSALDASAERGTLRLSAISLWEAQVLHSKGRL